MKHTKTLFVILAVLIVLVAAPFVHTMNDGAENNIDKSTNESEYTEFRIDDSDSVDDSTNYEKQVSDFDVNIRDINKSIIEGERIEVTTAVTNEGTAIDNQTVELVTRDDSFLDSVSVELAPNESTMVQLVWSTNDGDADEYSLRVVSDDDREINHIEVKETTEDSTNTDSTSSSEENNEYNTESPETNNSEDTIIDDSTQDSSTQEDSENSDGSTADSSKESSIDDTTQEDSTDEYDTGGDSIESDTTDQDNTNQDSTQDSTQDSSIDEEDSTQEDDSTQDSSISEDGDQDSTQDSSTQEDSTQDGSTDEGDSTQEDDSTQDDSTQDDGTNQDDTTQEEPAEYVIQKLDEHEYLVDHSVIELTAHIENIGDKEEPQNVSLEVEGYGVVDKVSNISIANGSTNTYDLYWDISSDDFGNQQIKTQTDDDTKTKEISIQSLTTTSGVVSEQDPTEGDPIEDAAIENATVRSVTQDGEIIDTNTTTADGEYTVISEGVDYISVSVTGNYTIQNTESPHTNHTLHASITETLDDSTNISVDTTSVNQIVQNETIGEVEKAVVNYGNETILLESIEQVQAINTYDNGEYKLISDINATETDRWNANEGFTQIEGFSGTLNGDEHEIQDLHMDHRKSEFGLIGTATSATIENITLTNVDVTGSFNVGGLVGRSDYNTNIRNVHVTGNITATATGDGKVGGIVGFNKGTINRSSTDVVVSGSYKEVGGIAGDNSGHIKDVSAKGSIETSSRYVGGIAGSNTNGEIVDSVATTDITGGSYVAGLVGNNNFGTVSSSYWDTTATIEEEYLRGEYTNDVSNTGVARNEDGEVNSIGGISED